MKKGKLPKPTKYIPHPRYGNKPRYTGLNPYTTSDEVHLGANAYMIGEMAASMFRELGLDAMALPRIEACVRSRLIEDTAIVADTTKQKSSPVHITHYFDRECMCIDCKGLFIFYAAEQKYWYEDLQFDSAANCIRCQPCRKIQQDLAAAKRRHDLLVAHPKLSVKEQLELVTLRLQLVEAGIFSRRQLEKVRAFLNSHPTHKQAAEIRSRMEGVEQVLAARGGKRGGRG